ncbi:MAG TPA: hypothetical protein VLY24_28220 [Bryobacteraceae bacterium]|nr:hypothetical protein [Bryobacteraceae bacterium]
MAVQAKGAHVGEIALASAFRDGHDVVRIPQIAARTPFLLETLARGVIQFALVFPQGFRVHPALRADASVARKDLFPEIAGIGAQPPFVHARQPAKS